MRYKISLSVIILLLFVHAVFAQNGKYQFSQLNRSNGLSNNQVNSVFKDSEGFMWFGTAAGLNRYDGYTFKVFKHDVYNKKSLNDDFVTGIFEGPGKKLWVSTRSGYCFYDPETEQFDSDISLMTGSLKLPGYPFVSKIIRSGKGEFWFVCPDSGLYSHNEINKTTRRYYHHRSGASLHSNLIADIAQDVTGNIWLAYRDGVVERLDIKQNRITYRTDVFSKAANNKDGNYSITVDKDNDLWLYSSNFNSGAYYYSPSSGAFRHITDESAGAKLKSNIISNIIQADDGLIWIGTDHGGINVLDKKDFTITYLLNREDDAKSLSQNSVILYKDDSGIMWANTFKEGISYYHKNIIRFPLYRHFASDRESLSFEDANKFVEEKSGNLWIGTNGGGLIYFNRKTGSFKQYKNKQGDPNSLSNDIIVSLCIDHDQKLWIGTYFGGLDCFDGKKFIHYKHEDKLAGSIADNRVWSILEDSSNRLWVGTFAGGLQIFDRDKKIFSPPLKQTDIRSPYVATLFEDRKGNIWVGGYFGVDVILKNKGGFIHYSADKKGSNSLISNSINCITQDSRGLIWIATREGLSIVNPENGSIRSLSAQSGLPDNTIMDILEDNRGAIWLSTANGLSRITFTQKKAPYAFRFENFDETDGLQGKEFNTRAALKTAKGELIFGGGHGFNIFDPLTIHANIYKPRLIFTDFLLFNKSIKANEEVNGHVVLSKAISATRELTLTHSENVFTIEFAALNFFNPNKVRHQYMMEGFDKDWLDADNAIRKATYTNLDGGDYIFKVRAISQEGKWDPDYITLKIKVLPPFWKSTIAYFIYVMLLAGALFFMRRRGIQKIRRQFEVEKEKQEAKLLIEHERQEARRMHELDMMKIKFFTNVSHEFRTPLSLIMAPVDKILKHTEAEEQRYQLQLINRNAKRLLNMVNQLLDFRKMEVQELRLHARNGDIISFIKEMVYSFSDVAEKKHIRLVFDSEIQSMVINFDHDKIERILFNLLSNAFKFTPDDGNVSVLLAITGKAAEKQLLEIKVIDTGIGIPLDKQDKIFERFFQNEVPGSMVNQGSGIGLSITKEFVKLHNGEISVESETGRGSCFTILLPVDLTVEEQVPANKTGKPGPEMTDNQAWLQAGSANATKKLTVLLVEDNEDFRFYLKDNLSDTFNIIEAANGREGWQKSLALHPNLVVSDISMPEMNGIDLCRKIRNDKRTSHIPVILLTAVAGEEQQLHGLETGANDYLTKPFNFEILMSKLKNILAMQEDMRKTYQKQLDVKPTEVETESFDEAFIKKAVQLIEKNIDNADFSVEELSSELFVSRVTLYKRALALTGKSPVDLIRSIRLKRAAQLLESSQLTISQISYKVGFKSQKYFVRCFKAEFNCLPSAYVGKKNK